MILLTGHASLANMGPLERECPSPCFLQWKICSNRRLNLTQHVYDIIMGWIVLMILETNMTCFFPSMSPVGRIPVGILFFMFARKYQRYKRWCFRRTGPFDATEGVVKQQNGRKSMGLIFGFEIHESTRGFMHGLTPVVGLSYMRKLEIKGSRRSNNFTSWV